MPWFKVDDGFHGHPKVVELSLEAVGLWTLTGSWCAKYLTDGFVPDKTVTRLGGNHDAAAELVMSNLWGRATGGYEFKDWADYQPLKEDVEAERLAAQERMKKVRAAKKGVRPNIDRTDAERSPEQTANFARSSEEVRVAPSQSHPSPIPTPSSTKKRGTASGARLPDDWQPSTELRKWAAENSPHVNWPAETEKFADYWRAQPGAKGRKTDWDATWRNWMRRQEEQHVTPKAATRTQQNLSVVERYAAAEQAEQRGITA